MPSHSIHLLVAYKYNPSGSAEFYIGNIAPDAVRDREDKDRTHLRNLPETERVVALAGLAKRLDLSRDENLGAVLHLYTDILWDTSQLKRYIQSYGEGWFRPYRQQTAIAGAWMYHNLPEIRRLWELVAGAVENSLAVNACRIICERILGDCKIGCGVECGNVREMILYNYSWNVANNPDPSPAFPPDVIERFADSAARSFAAFLRDHGLLGDAKQ